MKIPKFFLGLATVLLGAGLSVVPVLQVASPTIMTVGGGLMVVGAGGKAKRYIKGGDMFEHEKSLIKKVRKNNV